MTSVFREVPSHFQYLVFYTHEEIVAADDVSEPPTPKVSKKKCQGHTEIIFPKSLCSFLKQLLRATSCENTVRKHLVGKIGGTEDVCSQLQNDQYHIPLHLKSFVGAEKLIKETIGDILTEDKIFKIKNSLAKLYAITYPEICSKTEVTLQTNNLFIHGEKIKEMMKATTTNGLECKSNLTWEFHRTSYTEFDDDVDLEKLSYLSKKLVELQHSDAPLKYSVIDFIDPSKRGFGNINASHHKNTLSIDLGYSNAQCQCFECVDLPNQGNTMNNYQTSLFSYIDENAQFIQPFE